MRSSEILKAHRIHLSELLPSVDSSVLCGCSDHQTESACHPIPATSSLKYTTSTDRGVVERKLLATSVFPISALRSLRLSREDPHEHLLNKEVEWSTEARSSLEKTELGSVFDFNAGNLLQPAYPFADPIPKEVRAANMEEAILDKGTEQIVLSKMDGLNKLMASKLLFMEKQQAATARLEAHKWNKYGVLMRPKSGVLANSSIEARRLRSQQMNSMSRNKSYPPATSTTGQADARSLLQREETNRLSAKPSASPPLPLNIDNEKPDSYDTRKPWKYDRTARPKSCSGKVSVDKGQPKSTLATTPLPVIHDKSSNAGNDMEAPRSASPGSHTVILGHLRANKSNNATSCLESPSSASPESLESTLEEVQAADELSEIVLPSGGTHPVGEVLKNRVRPKSRRLARRSASARKGKHFHRKTK